MRTRLKPLFGILCTALWYPSVLIMSRTQLRVDYPCNFTPTELGLTSRVYDPQLCACSPQLPSNTQMPKKLQIHRAIRTTPSNSNTFIAKRPEVHHCGHNSPPLDHILSQLNPVHILSTYPRPAVMLHYHLRLRLLTVQHFLTNTVHTP